MARKQTDTKRARPSNTDNRIRWIIQIIMKFRGKWLYFPARNLALTFHSAWKRLLTLWKTLNVGWSVVYWFLCILTLCQHFIALVQVFCWRARQAQTCWVFQLCRPPSPSCHDRAFCHLLQLFIFMFYWSKYGRLPRTKFLLLLSCLVSVFLQTDARCSTSLASLLHK